MKPNITKSEGSRGGVVIGRTATGKAIYAPTKGMVQAQKTKVDASRAGKPVSEAQHNKHSAHNQEHHARHDAFFEGWSGADHHEAATTHQDAARAHSLKHGYDSHEASAHRSLSNTHRALSGVHAKYHHAPHNHPAITQAKHQMLDYTNDGPGTKKATSTPSLTKSESKEPTMENKESVDDIFKGMLGGDTESPLTSCIHCNEGLTREDLQKGLKTSFVKEDNNQPHSGGKGSAPSARAKGGKETDDIAPLLKGENHGDGEEFFITKGEMGAMGMDTSDVSGDQASEYKITKGEMVRLGADQHVPYLRGKKLMNVTKSLEPGVGVHGANLTPEAMPVEGSVTPVHTATMPELAKGGMAHNPNGNPLVQWVEGDDEAIAKAIEVGSLGQGADEPLRSIHKVR